MPGASRAGKDVAVAKMLVAPPSSKMAADWRAKFMLERDIYSQLEARGVPGIGQLVHADMGAEDVDACLYFAKVFAQPMELNKLDMSPGARPSVRTLFECLDELHELGYVHRDVRPYNIMVDMGSREPGVEQPAEWKLIDFGFCVEMGKTGEVVASYGGTVTCASQSVSCWVCLRLLLSLTSANIVCMSRYWASSRA